MSETQSAPRIENLMVQHRSLVERVLRQCGVAGGDLDDAAQRVFITACGKLAAIQVGSERAFLRAVASREASHMRRTYRRRRELPESEAEHPVVESMRPDRLAVRKARATTVTRVIDGMKSDLRRVLLLVEVEGHGLGEVAATLGIPLGTCKSRLRRARADLSLRIDALPDSVRSLVRS
jgi:RNA polymerase sigma-70 factor (ECF subfamily)